jgi:aminopeptidase-like protein
VQRLLEVVQVLEENARYLNLEPRGEPQLGRRGLYRQMGGIKEAGVSEMAMLWVLNYADGGHDLLDIATRSGMGFREIATAARALRVSGLLERMVPAE